MPSAFFRTVFDSPSIPPLSSTNAFNALDNDLISIKDDPDAFALSPLHLESLDNIPSLSVSPVLKASAYDRSQLRLHSDADVSTDSNASTCPATPPSKETCGLLRQVLSDESAYAPAQEETKFFREILTTYADVSSPLRYAPSPVIPEVN